MLTIHSRLKLKVKCPLLNRVLKMPLPLDTDRLIVRPFHEDDLEALGAWMLDPEVTRYLLLSFRSLDELRPRIEMYNRRHDELGYSFWAMERKEDKLVIGGCGLLPIGWVGPDVEIAWHMRKDCWGMGYTPEAARAILDYGINELKLPRIWALLMPENDASRRVAQKVGMEYVGLGSYKGHPHEFYIVPKGTGSTPPNGPDLTPPDLPCLV
jgi:RimJ/RimL family protein N-acetyltransferase